MGHQAAIIMSHLGVSLGFMGGMGSGEGEDRELWTFFSPMVESLRDPGMLLKTEKHWC